MSSASFNTSSSAGRYLQFSWEQKSISIENNTSVIAWKLTGQGNAGYVICGPIKVVINNQTVYDKADRVQVYPGTVVASGNYTFHHADDGTGFTAASVEAAIYSGSVNCTGFDWIALDTIARASQPTLSATSTEMGKAVTINTNRKSTAFKHTVKYAFGNASGTIGTAKAVEASVSWTIPTSLAAQIPNAVSGQGTITVETYNGSTLVGTKSVAFTATVPASIKPTIAAPTVTEATAGLATKFGAFVQNKSTLKIVSAPKGVQGSTITECKVTVNGSTYSGTTITTNPITASGTVRITVSIKDSRGRSASVTKDVTVTAYAPPKILAFKVQRCRSDGTLDESGTAFKVTMHFEISPVGSKNDRNFAVQVQEQGVTTWTDAWSGQASYTYDSSKVLTTPALAASKSYTVRLLLSDYFVQNYGAEADVQSSFRLVNYNASGKGIAFGKFSEGNDFDCALPAKFRDGLTLINNGTNIDLLNILDELFYKPGDSITLPTTFRTAGFLTTSGTEVLFIVPLSKPMRGVSKVTATSVNGFVLRQAGKYTHGSAASTFVKPTSYTAIRINGVCIAISAIFSTTTNAINNDPIGVQWSGKLTFA